MSVTTVDRIDALLPQTQCTRCGYDGCRPYAQALADAQAAINRCPPGGPAGIGALAALLGREPLPLDPACGSDADPGVAWIDPEACIGCARCLPPCPVDAIIGAQRYLHTVFEARLYRLRAVHRQLPGGLHRHAAARCGRCGAGAGRQPRPLPGAARARAARRPANARHCWPSANAARPRPTWRDRNESRTRPPHI